MTTSMKSRRGGPGLTTATRKEPDEHVWTSPENCMILIEERQDVFVKRIRRRSGLPGKQRVTAGQHLKNWTRNVVRWRQVFAPEDYSFLAIDFLSAIWRRNWGLTLLCGFLRLLIGVRAQCRDNCLFD